MNRYFSAVSALFIASATSLPAAIIINVQQSGSDVLMSASGMLDISGLNPFTTFGATPWNADPGGGALHVGEAVDLFYYSGLSAVGGSFGDAGGEKFIATSLSGGPIFVSNQYIGLPVGYVSGTSLEASGVFGDATFETLGFTEGSYVWDWSSDSITLNITAVPEPSTYAVFAGAAVLGLAFWRRAASGRGWTGCKRTQNS